MTKSESKGGDGGPDGSGPSRKRRRKTNTAGAADDCFACQKRQAACDRRRPYCGQCISLGQACSGYKTQLTWGVGVASRGKLRGMTLPVTSASVNAKTATPTSKAAATTSTPGEKEPIRKPGGSSPTAKQKDAAALPADASSAKLKRRRRSSSSRVEAAEERRQQQQQDQPQPQNQPQQHHHQQHQYQYQRQQQQQYSQHHLQQQLQLPPVQRLDTDTLPPATFFQRHASPQYSQQTSISPRSIPISSPRSQASEHWHHTVYHTSLPSNVNEQLSQPSLTESSSATPRLPRSSDSSSSSYPSGAYVAARASTSNLSDLSSVDSTNDPLRTPERGGLPDPFAQYNQYGYPPSQRSILKDGFPDQSGVAVIYGGQQGAIVNSPDVHNPLQSQLAIMQHAPGMTGHLSERSPIHSQARMDAALSMTGLRGRDGSPLYADSQYSDFSHGRVFDLDDPTFFEDAEDEDYVANSLMLSPNYLSNPFHNCAPRMQHLLEYFSKFICGVLVTVDGADNPYRRHVLSLAVQNEGLQHAIGALVTNNMRIRTLNDTQRMKEEANPFLRKGESKKRRSMIQAPTPEEQWYKAKSIEHLNLQLSSQGSATDDSVLASLLILCLFHVCDTGFSKFRTQLSGVQKLLKMRGRSVRSEFIGWIEMFFAWFDVMSSSVNDREVEIQGESLNFLDLSRNFGALEKFSGCEGRLFKIIARLGRLNLLSQNRPVKDLSRESRRPSFEKSDAGRSPNHGLTDFYSLSSEDLASDEWQPLYQRPNIEKGQPPDERHNFWREWRDIRRRLEDWSIDTPYQEEDNTGGPQARTPTSQDREIRHISEAFRYAALIYTERLAFPHSPSASANLQQLVTQAMFHINGIAQDSCVIKFMLWPLFITGTECVDEAQREAIRIRCIEIQQESGFYNNLSGLRVLERVWQQSEEPGSADPQGAMPLPQQQRGLSPDGLAAGGLASGLFAVVGAGAPSVPAGPGPGAAGAGAGMSAGAGTGTGAGAGACGGQQKYEQAFKWRRAMDRADGEYIVI